MTDAGINGEFDVLVAVRFNGVDARLIAFKAAYGKSKDAMDACLKQFVPALSEQRRQTFLYAFLPFVYGLYPYTMVTEKQKQAMREAGISYVYMSTYEMAFDFIRTLLGGLL